MAEIVKTKFHDSEIAKQTDFADTASHAVALACSLLDGANQDVENSFVLSGLEVEPSAPASMNVVIRAGLGFDRFSSKFLHLDADMSVAVGAAAPATERIDTIEVRFLETDFDEEARAFKDPVNGTVAYMNVATKTLVSIEARCLAGSPGAGSAPLVEFGWVKLAEVRVQAAAGAIYADDIRGITAQTDTAENAAWTIEKAASFRQGSFDALKASLASHMASAITGGNTVHGIRQGHTNGLDSDTLDSKHASDFSQLGRTAGEYIENYHSVSKSNGGSYEKTIEFKIKKSGTYTTRVLAHGSAWNEDVAIQPNDLIQLYSYQELVSPGQYNVYCQVNKNGTPVGVERVVSAGDIGGNYIVALALMCAEEGWLYSLG